MGARRRLRALQGAHLPPSTSRLCRGRLAAAAPVAHCLLADWIGAAPCMVARMGRDATEALAWYMMTKACMQAVCMGMHAPGRSGRVRNLHGHARRRAGRAASRFRFHVAWHCLFQDLVTEVAAGAAARAGNHSMFKLEDIAVGSWVAYIGGQATSDLHAWICCMATSYLKTTRIVYAIRASMLQTAQHADQSFGHCAGRSQPGVWLPRCALHCWGQ